MSHGSAGFGSVSCSPGHFTESQLGLQVITKRLRLSGSVDFQAVAARTPGFAGADLQALTKEAAAIAVSRIFEATQGSSDAPQASESTSQVCSGALLAHNQHPEYANSRCDP